MSKHFRSDYHKTEYYIDKYDFIDEEDFVSGEDKCTKCGEQLDMWWTETDCCGSQFSCKIDVKHRCCHKCEVITNGYG